MGPNKDMDRISNLPNDIIENILLRLSIRDSVRTSILSRGWRYQWNTIPELVLDRDSMPLSNINEQEKVDNKIVAIVDQVLLLHQGPIRKFMLSTDLERDVDIDRWILFLSKNGIKELILDKCMGERYKVPSCLFSCEQITNLQLFRCKVVVPALFRGFESLSTLALERVTISSEGLEVMISRCPMLKKLILKDVDGCDHLNIHGKKLVYLSIEAGLKEVCLKSCQLLVFASISLNIGEDTVLIDGGICKLVDVFGNLPKIESLKLHDDSLKIFTSGNVPPRLPATCHLRYLSVELNLDDMQEMLGAFSIFRSSPVLEELTIKALVDTSKSRISSKGFWEAQEHFNCLFSRLQTIKFTNLQTIKFKNLEVVISEFKFIEFVLANAPVLEAIEIKFQYPLNDVRNTFDFIRFAERHKKFRSISFGKDYIVAGYIDRAPPEP